MLYIMPKTKWADYNKAGGQLSLLQDAKDAILEKRYPTTKVKVDRLVCDGHLPRTSTSRFNLF